ncbi:hypothetical protein BG015_005781 [Linnemannia schmuckeri]|uniref:Uncharacterized protein n=1 Tax=Linnemannia schmuckeri TaxID=64567 RepID=A0A9P5VCE2_9FUNG|nr:hypothetical protein BG015_005781 [Linnemannia schmuckeri]
MVRQRSHSSAYRTSQEVPETPLTPRTPRSPHLHRSRLTSPSVRSRTGIRGGLKREFPEDEDLDMDDMPSRRAHLPNPTPSELLSMDLTTLALHNRNTNNSNSSSGSRSALATPSPSARFRDDAAVELFNLTLPFDRITSPSFTFSSSSSSMSSPSPYKSSTFNNNSNNNHYSSSSLESVHRYPTRTSTTQHDITPSSPFTTPVKAGGNRSPFLRNGSSTPTASSSAAASFPSTSIFSPRSALQSPPRSNPRQFMNDEDNNLFLTQSPRAIRTPRKPMSQLENNSNITTQSPADRLTPNTSTSAAQTSTSSTDYSASTSTTAHSYIQPVPTPAALMTPGASQTTESYDDDMTDTESVLSSQGDQEKENVTPKMSDDPSNPFFVSSDSKRTMRYTKTDGSTTPTGCTTAPGTIRRSRRLALGSISPWRWNSFDEHGNLLYSGLGAGLLKGKGSDWTEGKQTKSVTAGCSGEPSVGSSSGSSSAASSSSMSKAAMTGPSLNGKTSKQLPDNHPNAPDISDRKGVPSRTAMKNAESIIEPQSVAFNRRAQKMAGSIFYWKNGNYQLVSETDKQQWPGEWKFEVYQDPESPGAPSAAEDTDHAAATSHSSTTASSSTTAAYFGKGKLTDRQLSGPSSKRMRIGAGNETFHQSVGSSPHASESDLTGAGSIDIQDPVPPPSPTPMSAMNTSSSNSPQASKLMGGRAGTPSKKARMQDRYDFRERRMLNEPLTPRSRRCGA